MRIFVSGGGTGGHLYPGLAIARALVAIDPSIRPHFLGAKRGIERDVLPTTEFPFTLLDLHPIYYSSPLSNWHTLSGGVAALRSIGRLARGDERPACVIGTGGYAAAAALAWAGLKNIPIVLHECDSYPGKVTRLFAPRSKLLSLGFPEARSRLSPGKSTLVLEYGNPVIPPDLGDDIKRRARERWSIKEGSISILISGGSQGSAVLNQAVAAWCNDSIPEGVNVIWATGRAHYDKWSHMASAHLKIEPYISPMSEAYSISDLAVTRAGAMTIAELCAWGIPSVLVPLPSAAHDHQTHNARSLANAGASILLPQTALGLSSLQSTIGGLLAEEATLKAMSNAALKRGRPDAVTRLAEGIASWTLGIK